MAKNFLAELKVWLPAFKVNGEWIKSPKLKFNGHILGEDIKEFLYEALRLFSEGALNKETTIWFNSHLGSVKDAIEYYNSQCEESDTLNLKTAQSKVTYDKKRVANYFSDGSLFITISYPDEYLEAAWDGLFNFCKKYNTNREYNNSMVLKMDSNVDIVKSISSDDWEQLVEIISTYSKKRIQELESGNAELSKDMIGYFNYLINSKRLTDRERKRLEMIRGILGLEA